MKTYFNNITTAEELKNQFRELCQTMHPDKGGNAEEFKNMLNEYEQAQKRAGGWSKQEREAVAVLRRGVSVIFYGAGMNETHYIITSATAEAVELVRVFSRDFQAVEDLEYYDEDGQSRTSCGKYSHIDPLSKKFGIGYYWDDITGKTYTEAEIIEAERVADNFDKWAKVKQEQKAEKERKAQEEADRAEAAIIAQWSHILKQLPPLHKSKTWQELDALPRSERKAQQEADKKAERRANAQRLAAFKRNIKAVFNHYFPGIKVSVSDTSKCWAESSVISWVDGPTVAEVEAVEAFDYFRAHGWAAPDVYEDYGHRTNRRTLCKFREMFGAFSDESIKFERSFSEDVKKAVFAQIAEIIPDFAGKQRNDTITTTDKQAEEVIKFFGFSGDQWRPGMTEEETAEHYRKDREHESERARIRRVIAPSFQNYNNCYFQSIEQIFTDFYKIPLPEQTTAQAAEPQKTTEAPKAETVGEILAEADGVQLVKTDKGAEFRGNTYAHKTEIKATGARWFRLGQCWTIKAEQITEAVALVKSWAQDAEPVAEPQTEPEAVADAEPVAEPEPVEEPQEQEPTEAEKITAFFEAVESFARLWGYVASIKPEEPAEAKKDPDRVIITFAPEDCPDLDELKPHTPQAEAPQGATAEEVPQMTEEEREKVRRLFEIKSQRAEEATAENEHTKAVYLRGCALLSVLMGEKLFNVNDLLTHLQTIDKRHSQRGHILPDEQESRQKIADTLTVITAHECGEELAALLWGAYQVKQAAQQSQKAA